MKHATVIALLVLTLSIAGTAQMGSMPKISANVPFDFVAWNKTVPAGTCIVERAAINSPVLSILNVAANTGMLTMARPGHESAPTGNYSLVFHRYGTRHFLSQIKTPNGQAYELAKGRLERELLARNIGPVEEVLLASAK